jgi:hypothetical protein
MAKRILGIVGSYRKGGIVDRLVSETLAGAAAAGAETQKIYLTEKRVEFCRNCRTCMQAPGEEPGTCVIEDDLASILREWRASDGLVLGSPVNFYNVTAITRRFMERLVCFAYWPWGQHSPRIRTKRKEKRAVLITSSAMPALMGRLFTGAPRALRAAAETMGAKPVATLFAGMVAQAEHAEPHARLLRQAREADRRLAEGR